MAEWVYSEDEKRYQQRASRRIASATSGGACGEQQRGEDEGDQRRLCRELPATGTAEQDSSWLDEHTPIETGMLAVL